MRLKVNGQEHEVDVPHDVPLLWVIREELELTGTKFGCGKALCGACTVHLDGKAIRSCVTPVSDAVGHEVTTIEGVGSAKALHPIQQAWVDGNVPQCGFCQPGQVMCALSLLRVNAKPDDADIDSAMSGNICRCGMYPRIRAAIKKASGR